MKRYAVALLAILSALALGQDFTLTILHTNDLHAHVEPVKIKNNTYGGYARQTTLVRKYMASDKNPVLLSGGDTFQGTLYFREYTGLADLFFMNLMGYEGMAVGNHEFDLGPKALSDFVDNARFPLLSANLDFSAEPVLAGKIKPYTAITVAGQKIGLVGATTPDVTSISSPGPNIKLMDLDASIQQAVDDLHKEGVNKIILLSHLGYGVEKKVAENVKGIDVIVGGHSHTLLGDFKDPNLPKSEGPYPTIEKDPNGNTVLLLSAWEWGKVFGRIVVTFDHEGHVKKWSNDQPIIVDNSVPDDPLAASAVAAFVKPMVEMKHRVITTLETDLPSDKSPVQESKMGDYIADAMLDAGQKVGAQIAIMNGGGVRASLEKGPVTFETAIQVQPFGNTLVEMDLTGDQLKQVLEYSIDATAGGKGRCVQVSKGFHFTFDTSKPEGSRLTGADLNGTPLDGATTYKVMLNNFCANGGDGFTMLASSTGKRLDTGMIDIDAFVDYLKNHTSAPDDGPREEMKKAG
ncbi:MAG TPA: bifunctional metallophosphatase/5'-nucleotidase [Fimbriimonadaceae bacterium]|jgi:5'-nucleotidase